MASYKYVPYLRDGRDRQREVLLTLPRRHLGCSSAYTRPMVRIDRTYTGQSGLGAGEQRQSGKSSSRQIQ